MFVVWLWGIDEFKKKTPNSKRRHQFASGILNQLSRTTDFQHDPVCLKNNNPNVHQVNKKMKKKRKEMSQVLFLYVNNDAFLTFRCDSHHARSSRQAK